MNLKNDNKKIYHVRNKECNIAETIVADSHEVAVDMIMKSPKYNWQINMEYSFDVTDCLIDSPNRVSKKFTACKEIWVVINEENNERI